MIDIKFFFPCVLDAKDSGTGTGTVDRGACEVSNSQSAECRWRLGSASQYQSPSVNVASVTWTDSTRLLQWHGESP
ncbi:hypothetical protein FOVSG1_014311 [Fusarium oxysporum f. sp. vasinfectum]